MDIFSCGAVNETNMSSWPLPDWRDMAIDEGPEPVAAGGGMDGEIFLETDVYTCKY